MPATKNGWTAHDWQHQYEILRADWAHRTGIPHELARDVYWPTHRPPIHQLPREDHS